MLHDYISDDFRDMLKSILKADFSDGTKLALLLDEYRELLKAYRILYNEHQICNYGSRIEVSLPRNQLEELAAKQWNLDTKINPVTI